MPYMMAGFPDRESSLAIAAAYADSGADLIELGVPFSDPLADGPTIHAAATAALASGATFATALEACASVSDRVPVVLHGLREHGARARRAGRVRPLAAAAGAAGAIVPDLPLGEAEEVREAFDVAGLALVPLVAPTTPAERRARICASARGFVYVVSTVGTTGERDELPPGLAELVSATKARRGGPGRRRLRNRHAGAGGAGGRGRRRRHRRQPPRPRGRRGRLARGRRRRGLILPLDTRDALAA